MRSGKRDCRNRDRLLGTSNRDPDRCGELWQRRAHDITLIAVTRAHRRRAGLGLMIGTLAEIRIGTAAHWRVVREPQLRHRHHEREQDRDRDRRRCGHDAAQAHRGIVIDYGASSN